MSFSFSFPVTHPLKNMIFWRLFVSIKEVSLLTSPLPPILRINFPSNSFLFSIIMSMRSYIPLDSHIIPRKSFREYSKMFGYNRLYLSGVLNYSSQGQILSTTKEVCLFDDVIATARLSLLLPSCKYLLKYLG